LKRVSLVAQVHNTSETVILDLRNLVDKDSGANSVLVAKPLEQILADSIKTPRARATMFGIIAVIAVLLAAAGIYGMLSWSIEVGLREIGIRTALGAQPHQIVAFVLRQTVLVTVAGILVGISGAVLAGRAMVTLLYNTKPTDLTPIAAAALITVTISALASAIPARRATRVDPLVVMRSE
jgi:putative ABC transport system permease protein